MSRARCIAGMGLLAFLCACEGGKKSGAGPDGDADTDTGTGTGSSTGSSTGGLPCMPPFARCEDAGEKLCILLDSDPRNCGECGNECGDRTPVCLRGRCAESCEDLTECDGACVDLATDRLHCGACGGSCAAEGLVCEEGRCRCWHVSLTLCGDMCFDLQSNPAACGRCDSACREGEVCYRGTCAADCGELTDCGIGQCADLETDPGNCGACSRGCFSDGYSCCGGECVKDRGGGDSDSDTDCPGTG